MDENFGVESFPHSLTKSNPGMCVCVCTYMCVGGVGVCVWVCVGGLVGGCMCACLFVCGVCVCVCVCTCCV